MDLTLLDTAQLHKAQANAGQAVRSVKDAGRDGRAREAAEAFEAMVIAQMLAPMFATLPDDIRDALGASVPFPSRLGDPQEYAALVRHICENDMLNGECIRLDGAVRLAPK